MNNMFKSIPMKSGDKTKLGIVVNAEENQEIRWEGSGLLGYHLNC